MSFFSNRRLILILVCLIWIEFSLAHYFSLGEAKPNFPFLFLVFYAFRVQWKRLVTLAFGLGLALDLLTNVHFGLQTASLVVGAVILKFFAVRFDRDKRWIQLACLFSFSWSALLGFALLSVFVEGPNRMNEWMLGESVFASLYTTAVGACLFPLLEKWLVPALRPKQYELF